MHDGRDIFEGFAEGANINAKYDKSYDCMADKLQEVAYHSNAAVADLKKTGFSERISGMKEISIMLDLFRKAEKDCLNMSADWETIDQMSLAWDLPITFSYRNEYETCINRRCVQDLLK